MAATATRRSLDGKVNDKAVGGFVLVAIGLLLVASYVIAGFGEYLMLGIAIVCLIAFAGTRQYGYAVVTGITGGIGVGILLTTMFTDPMDGVAFLAAFAAGFVVVWLLGLVAEPRETNPWPLIPAAFFAATAVTVATENPILLNAVIVISVVALIAGGLKTIRDARSES